MPGVTRRGDFLSYRRDDAGPYARSLQLQLSQRVPDALVFMDLDSIEPCLDFAEVIEEALNSSAVLVALIGRQWATVTDEDGARRLDNPDDYVRFEVTTALERGVRVIPVLIDGARALRRQDLPEGLHKLARLNAHKLSYDRYQDDADRLLDLIQRVLAAVGQEPETERERELPARNAENSADRQAQDEAEQEAREKADVFDPTQQGMPAAPHDEQGNYENPAGSGAEIPGLRLTPEERERRVAKFRATRETAHRHQVEEYRKAAEEEPATALGATPGAVTSSSTSSAAPTGTLASDEALAALRGRLNPDPQIQTAPTTPGPSKRLVEMVMPQIGSDHEGTVTRWLKRQGAFVRIGEPLCELSTDQVDVEIPSPVTGFLRRIDVDEDETVSVGTTLAIIEEPPERG